jgi:predicted nucleotidyltransferase
MNVGRPHMSLAPTLDGEALRVLAGTKYPLTGREIARLAGHGSQRGIAAALDRLVEQGLVLRREAGAAALYTLNRSHLAAPAAETLAEMRSELHRRLRAAIAAWDTQPVHASMFGSAARGDGDTSSDIDLFIVRPVATDEEDSTWRKQLSMLAEDVHAWTGNRASTIEIGEEEIDQLRHSQPPILASLRADAISLAGIPADRLLRIEATR